MVNKLQLEPRPNPRAFLRFNDELKQKLSSVSVLFARGAAIQKRPKYSDAIQALVDNHQNLNADQTKDKKATDNEIEVWDTVAKKRQLTFCMPVLSHQFNSKFGNFTE